MYARIAMLLGTLGLTLGWLLTPPHAAPKPRVEICHHQPDEGRWKLMTLPLPATQAHLRNHDDAFPGGLTTFTQTALDETCAPVVATSCPCEGLSNPPATWAAEFNTGVCLVNAVLGSRTLIAEPSSDGALHVSADTESCSLAVGGGAPVVERVGLSSGEVAACQASLQAIGEADVVLCVELQ